MADVVFNGRLTPQSSTQISVDEFDVQADFFDGLGMFSAMDIAVDDVVFLDCFASFTSPNTVNRYKVIQINSASGMQIDCRIKWDDDGVIVDPGEVVGSPGFISRASFNKKFPNHAAPTIHTIPDYVIQYSRNNDLYRIIDNITGGGGESSQHSKLMVNGDSEIISAGRPVAKKSDGTIVRADSDGVDRQQLIGISKAEIGVGATGDVYLFGQNIPGALTGLGFNVGDEIYLGENPGEYTNNPSSYSDADDSIIKIGIADCASGSASSVATDLILFPSVIVRP